MKLTHCVKCGKYVPADQANKLCSGCTGTAAPIPDRVKEAIDEFGKRTADEIAYFADIPKDEVLRILEDPEVQRLLSAPRPQCTRCGVRPAQRACEYCLDCRLELNRDLGTAAQDLATKVEEKGRAEHAPPSRPTASIFQTLEEKRGRGSL